MITSARQHLFRPVVEEEVKPDPRKPMSRVERVLAILRILRKRGALTSSEIHASLNCTCKIESIRVDLILLVNSGHIEAWGGRARTYVLADDSTDPHATWKREKVIEGKPPVNLPHLVNDYLASQLIEARS